ncbi:hypothetical protein NQ317_001203 [Molorchus minor]|uniref:Uncharacterized protein n=1 Tax=Molorchus minor TaxID=1323400 RepID=A0ABQ9JFC0_9CUCU|nr:hypothetical protein NQ317_001203 [Molorchus minor]
MVQQNNIINGSFKEDIAGGAAMSSPLEGEDIVISGLSGTFPDSKNVHEFRDNLFNKVNMVSPNRRWDYQHPEIPTCSGTLPEVNKYDPGFFGVHERQSQSLDAITRIFQERAVEAILDAGLHPSDLENTKTGVFMGVCFSESDKSWFFENLGPQTYAFTGAERSMMAHRLSYFLKLKGPSYITDTACSSSLYAFEHAFRAIRMGEIDGAIVGGANLCLHPFVSLQFARLGVLSKDGSCKAFDKLGNGYARSETVGAVLLQKSKDAKRIYAHVIHAKTSCDGYKAQGITYPSGPAQVALLNDFYDECGVDRYSLSFLEAHGTGTLVGDPEEGAAIDETLTKNRKTTLLMGAVKSNIGHTEPASGICAITKCIIGMETGFIPPNIHYTIPRDEIKGLIEKRMTVVADKMPFADKRGLIGINSFGFGGGNCHVLLRWNEKEKINGGIPKDSLPRLVCVSGRTEEAVGCLLDEISDNTLDAEHIKLLQDIFRGYILASKTGEIDRSNKFSPELDYGKTLHIAFGLVNNWYEVGTHLMEIPVFASTLQRVQKYLSTKGIDTLDPLLKKTSSSEHSETLGSLAIKIGIIDTLKLLEIKPKGNFGYSLEGLLCGYYDGLLSLEEIVECYLMSNEFVDESSDICKSINKNYKVLKSDESQGKEELLFQNLVTILSTSRSSKSSRGKQDSTDKILDALMSGESKNVTFKSGSIVLEIGNTEIGVTEDATVLNFAGTKSKNYLEEFLTIVGRLYQYGFNNQISKLYPAVEFPVSRGTRMIAPYIKWNHNRNLFVPQYNLEVKNVAQKSAKVVKVQLIDFEWTYIDGHIIDGRNLFPATGYLYLAWEAFSVIKGVPMSIMNIVFENCKFIRATSIPKKGHLRFTISIQEGTGIFEIEESDALVVTGRIYLSDDTNNDIEHYMPPELSELGPLPLTTKDVYKELRLRGYHYKGDFRAIQTCDVAATKGYIKWNDNWVTFIDNMLQMKILQTDSRLLYVPTYITKLCIDAKRHLELVNKKYKEADESPNLATLNNHVDGTISCGGIRLSGLIASSINKRKDVATPVLEEYKFVPNVTTLDAAQSVRVNIQIILENALVYKVKAVEVFDECTRKDAVPLAPIIQSAIGHQPLIQPLVKILSKTPLDVSVDVEDKKLVTETDCLLIVATDMLTRIEALKEAFASLKDNGYIISREHNNYDPTSTQHSDINILTVHRNPCETLVLLQRKAKSKVPKFIRISCSENFTWIPTVQEALKQNFNQDIVLYSQREPTSGLLGLVNCMQREPENKNLKCVFVADEEVELTAHEMCEQLRKNMNINVYKNGKWGTYRHLLLNFSNMLESEHCFANVTVRGDLSSLRWIEGSLQHDMVLPPETELIEVYYAALNFRDVMTASGKINVDVITQDRLEQECVQGFEFSGRDHRGNRIMGMVTHGALSTVILSDPALTYKIPDSWTLEEGATVPVVYGTVIYAMIIRGQMKRKESVLIHSGTGGIGQAAIRIALHYGCKVYTTVGSKEKRDFIKKTFPQIKDHQIGNSRDESFEHMIRKDTNGHGVDIVLNSLAEDKLIASVRCLAKGGRFLEIGKFDMANNNTLNLLLFQKEASFHGVMLDQLFTESPNIKMGISKILIDGIKYGAVKPLNRTVFKFNEVEQAFRYMAAGKHMGKVLVQVRKPEEELVYLPPVQKFHCIGRYLCDPEMAYVIVGGLGGFGLELADWLVLRGAKKIVLTSRKGMSTGYQHLRVRIWRSYGVRVYISQSVVSTEDGCKQLIEESLELGPIAAIFNLAVILADAIFENQTPETFATSFGPKATATHYLDKLSRKMCPTLREFVVFSSVSCGRGNAGQTNYGMANSVMERICEIRRSDGYPALAIQWGAIGDVGLVAEMKEDHMELEIGGTLQQRISNCLQTLDILLKQNESAIVSSMVVAEKHGGAAAVDNIVGSVISILGLNDTTSISLHSTLPELGMDSMTAVEIKQTLEREFEIFLTAKDIRTMTLARLMEIQEEKLEATQADAGQSSYFGLEMVFRLIGEESESYLPFMPLTSKPVTGNKDIPTAPNLLLFPGIEGFVKVFKGLSAQLDANAICMQYLMDGEEETIAEMADSVMPYVKKHIKKDVPFNIVAYSYGTLIALEVVSRLESKGYTGTIICIDGAPLLMKEMLKSLNTDSQHIFETALLCHLLSFYVSSEVVLKYKESIFKCNSWQDRLDLGAAIVKQRVGLEGHYQKKVASSIYRRLNALKLYSPSYSKLKSDIKLYKPKIGSIRGLPEDYGLSEFCEKPLEVMTFEGNHVTILENEMVAEALNAIINKNLQK